VSFTSLALQSRRFHAGWIIPARNAEQFAAYLARNRGEDFEALLICRREDSAVLGAINLSQIFRGGFQNAYVGYWIGAPYARCGYMGEALALALDHAFGTVQLHRLEANIQPTNIASKRLVERLGFRLEGFSPRYLKVSGRWCDHERWAILREDWRARRRYARSPPENK
jgi:ribosomal-protein-alanine N-acetyltransferase